MGDSARQHLRLKELLSPIRDSKYQPGGFIANVLMTQREFATDIFEFPEIADFCRSQAEKRSLHPCSM